MFVISRLYAPSYNAANNQAYTADLRIEKGNSDKHIQFRILCRLTPGTR
jgi:hypothetical protein